MGVIARASVERKTGKFEGKGKIFRGIKSVGSRVHLGCSESQEEVAKRLGVSHSALYAWVLKRHGRVREVDPKIWTSS